MACSSSPNKRREMDVMKLCAAGSPSKSTRRSLPARHPLSPQPAQPPKLLRLTPHPMRLPLSLSLSLSLTLLQNDERLQGTARGGQVDRPLRHLPRPQRQCAPAPCSASHPTLPREQAPLLFERKEFTVEHRSLIRWGGAVLIRGRGVDQRGGGVPIRWGGRYWSEGGRGIDQRRFSASSRGRGTVCSSCTHRPICWGVVEDPRGAPRRLPLQVAIDRVHESDVPSQRG